MKAVSDEQLVRWVAEGDPSCLATLFERHHRGLFRYLFRMLGQRAVCEDLVQDVFLKVLRRAGGFRGEGSFKAWLYNIARNDALDHLRKSGHRNVEMPDEEAMKRLVDNRSAEQAATGRQAASLVLEALSKLPAAAQEVIWLGRFEFDNYEELGRALGCNAGTARVRMHRAMTQLKSTYLGMTAMNGVPLDA